MRKTGGEKWRRRKVMVQMEAGDKSPAYDPPFLPPPPPSTFSIILLENISPLNVSQ